MSLGNPTLTLILTHTSCCDVKPGPSKLGTPVKPAFLSCQHKNGTLRAYVFLGTSSSSPQRFSGVICLKNLGMKPEKAPGWCHPVIRNVRFGIFTPKINQWWFGLRLGSPKMKEIVTYGVSLKSHKPPTQTTSKPLAEKNHTKIIQNTFSAGMRQCLGPVIFRCFKTACGPPHELTSFKIQKNIQPWICLFDARKKVQVISQMLIQWWFTMVKSNQSPAKTSSKQLATPPFRAIKRVHLMTYNYDTHHAWKEHWLFIAPNARVLRPIPLSPPKSHIRPVRCTELLTLHTGSTRAVPEVLQTERFRGRFETLKISHPDVVPTHG